jgi:hypothetical protein
MGVSIADSFEMQKLLLFGFGLGAQEHTIMCKHVTRICSTMICASSQTRPTHTTDERRLSAGPNQDQGV